MYATVKPAPPGTAVPTIDDDRCDPLPDACGNDERQLRLLERQERSPEEGVRCDRVLSRERNVIIACVVLVVLLNMEEGRWILYPFEIFSTWIHELCHALAAKMMGGAVSELHIYKDGSGMAYTNVPGGSERSVNFRAGFVSSAGYPGTAYAGCLLLLFRRTTLGPTIGTIGLGCALLLTCAIWVRNQFGLICLISEGVSLVLLGWVLPAAWLDKLYAFLACTICLNAVESIRDLFGSSHYVNGQEVSTDASSVADRWGLHMLFWSWFWLIQAIILTFVGIVFARDARELNRINNHTKATPTTAAVPMAQPVGYPTTPATTGFVSDPNAHLTYARVV